LYFVALRGIRTRYSYANNTFGGHKMKQNDKPEIETETRRGKRGAGRLYKRDGSGKECAVDDDTHGAFWLEYRVNGQRVRQRLIDSQGHAITERRKAEKERARILAPFAAKETVEQLRTIQAKLAGAETVYAQAIDEANPPLSIAHAWDAYLKSPDRPESGEGTMRNYIGQWNRFEKWTKLQTPKPLTLRDITPKTAQDYAATLNGGTVSPNTYNKHIAFLRLFFRVLTDAAGLKENPFDKIRSKNLKTNSRRELTIAELKKILEGATGEMQTLLYIGTFTGLRLGDCCTLTWGETDLDRGLIKRIPNKTAKNGKPVLIGIPSALHAKLSEIPPNQRTGYVLPKYAELYTYTNTEGDPNRRPDIVHEIQAHFKKCEIRTVRPGTGFIEKFNPKTGKTEQVSTGKRAVLEVGFHSLRHTWVSLHAAAGTPQAIVQNVIGHANPAMTAHYTHVSEDTARHTARAWQLTEPGAEPARAPLPDWVRDLAEGMTTKNWKQAQKKLLA
jgi:integrase